jgi:hypothetical protein
MVQVERASRCKDLGSSLSDQEASKRPSSRCPTVGSSDFQMLITSSARILDQHHEASCNNRCLGYCRV